MSQSIAEMLEQIMSKIKSTEDEISEIETIKAEKLSNGESLDNSADDFDVNPYIETVCEEIEV
jgi:hypothetical protein